jgi:hypothetical protein
VLGGERAQLIVRQCSDGGDGPQIVEGMRPPRRGDSYEARSLKRTDQHLLGETAVMGHVLIPRCNRRRETEEHVDRADRASGGRVGGVGQAVGGNQFGNALQVRTGEDNEAVWLEHATKLRERDGDLVNKEMFDVVTEKMASTEAVVTADMSVIEPTMSGLTL